MTTEGFDALAFIEGRADKWVFGCTQAPDEPVTTEPSHSRCQANVFDTTSSTLRQCNMNVGTAGHRLCGYHMTSMREDVRRYKSMTTVFPSKALFDSDVTDAAAVRLVTGATVLRDAVRQAEVVYKSWEAQHAERLVTQIKYFSNGSGSDEVASAASHVRFFLMLTEALDVLRIRLDRLHASAERARQCLLAKEDDDKVSNTAEPPVSTPTPAPARVSVYARVLAKARAKGYIFSYPDELPIEDSCVDEAWFESSVLVDAHLPQTWPSSQLDMYLRCATVLLMGGWIHVKDVSLDYLGVLFTMEVDGLNALFDAKTFDVTLMHVKPGVSDQCVLFLHGGDDGPHVMNYTELFQETDILPAAAEAGRVRIFEFGASYTFPSPRMPLGILVNRCIRVTKTKTNLSMGRNVGWGVVSDMNGTWIQRAKDHHGRFLPSIPEDARQAASIFAAYKHLLFREDWRREKWGTPLSAATTILSRLSRRRELVVMCYGEVPAGADIDCDLHRARISKVFSEPLVSIVHGDGLLVDNVSGGLKAVSRCTESGFDRISKVQIVSCVCGPRLSK